MNKQISTDLIMATKLVHYFMTEKDYKAVNISGVNNEVWLENINSNFKIIRVVSEPIKDNKAMAFDIRKTRTIMGKIRKKTFSLNLNVISFYINANQGILPEDKRSMKFVYANDIDILKKSELINKYFPNIFNKLKFTEEGMSLYLKMTADINSYNVKDAQRINKTFKKKIPYLTYILIVINVVVYIISLTNQTIIYNGWIEHSRVFINKEYYRIITYAFLHSPTDIMHIIFNMYSIFTIGSQVESYLGKTKFLIVYFVSAIMGGLLSMALNTVPSVGASAAIFGLLGSLLYFGYHYRSYISGILVKQILPVIIGNLIFGFLSKGIDNFGHIGGLIGGISVTMAIGIDYKTRLSEQISGAIITVILVIFFFMLGMLKI